MNDVAEEDATALFHKPILEFPDSVFDFQIREKKVDIGSDSYFQEILLEIDRADVPMKNVIRDIPTGDTHDIYKVSTGVKTLWLAYTDADYTFLSEWFGPNCYQRLFDISKTHDVYLYEDSNMFYKEAAEKLTGRFTDFKTNEVIEIGVESSIDTVLEHLEERGYY